ncbi:MAG TPA: DedA family protein [Candidatus Marinimicrobia bacterium]|jgi:membrane protein DedA with SNARE-associated domain|nr:DedA family protein [Candidatus Neomarinimicrobiota bacterium]OQC47550.1 MAG: Inner membrane protein YqjA [Candidatus Marinimicrobia bacterium ADurb.Bin030]HNZ36205.1 DedA family protein [Candidatus Neomarinimicrobiota bacterium]HOD38470.1 DedA family protein [Candidatus Neomarinimicrobiota bacterium]HOV23986.1 DedA family protein [Candidatus Neomarinimicrobiota bacterium]
MNALAEFLTTGSGWIVYVVLFILIFLENVIPFIPGDTVLAFSSYLAGIGILNSFISYPLTVIAAVVGFIFTYVIAYFWGRAFIDRKNFPAFPPRKMARIDRLFHKYGYMGLGIGRFLPGTRLLMAFMAGFTRLRMVPALACISFGIIGWNMLIYLLGYLVGGNRQAIAAFISQYNHIASLIVLALIVILIAWRVNQKIKKLGEKTSD